MYMCFAPLLHHGMDVNNVYHRLLLL